MNPPIDLRINPDLDVPALAAAYARDGRIQIPHILPEATAEAITTWLETSIPWSCAYWGADDRPHYQSLQEMKAQTPQQYGAFLQDLYARTGQGYGFLHMSYRMITAYLAGTEPGHPIHKVTEFLNSPAFLDFGRAVTGDPAIRKADAQASLYRPGDFIGRHDDSAVEGVDRSAAYTLGFTRTWRSDWGGQLMFHDERGDVARALVPRWNTLSLFRTPQSHSVAPVAPYAQAPRLSIIGWLRRDL